MPRQQATGITIGFLGTGSMEVDEATGLIEEYCTKALQEDDPVTLVFPLTSGEFSDTMGDLVRMAKANDLSYQVVTNKEDKNRRAFVEIANDAAKTYHVADVFTQMESILSEAPRSALMVIWDDERSDELTRAITRFYDADIPVLDLSDGLTPLVLENGDDDSEPAETGGDEEEGEAPAEAYAKSDLEKLSRDEVKSIAASLGLPPRRSSAAMIDEILEAQGGYSEAVAEVAEVVEEIGDIVAVAAEADASLVEALEMFPGRVADVFDNFLTQLGITLEGVIFNATPEEPMAVEEPEPEPEKPARRRLVRSR
jgi:hypothetical protein